MQRWKENYSIDFHQSCSKHINQAIIDSRRRSFENQFQFLSQNQKPVFKIKMAQTISIRNTS